MNTIVVPLIAQGQSPYVIVANHPELNISVKGLYNYINQGVLPVRDIDLKRKVKFKPRRCRKEKGIDRNAFIGRTHADFQALSPSRFCEMDTVLSARGLTNVFGPLSAGTELLIACILNRRTKGAVKAVFDRMEQALGTYDFLTVFGICLTDRGSEFGDPNALETGINGIERMSLYYCDPMRSNQKGGIEEVHTLLRMIIPEGTVFTHLPQWDIRKCVDHINGYAREKLGSATPYDLSLQKFGPDILRALQLKYVAPDEVTLTPKLLK